MGKGHEGGAIQYPYGDPSVEQSQSVHAGGIYLVVVADRVPTTQTFTPALNCGLSAYKWGVGHWGSVTGTITFKVTTTDLSGKPTATVLASKVFTVTGLSPTGDKTYTVTFDSIIPLTSGVKYAITQEFSGDWSGTGINWAMLGVTNESDVYTRGEALWYETGAWNDRGTNSDYQFWTIIDPPGVQEYAKTEIVIADDVAMVQIKVITPYGQVYLSDPIGMTLQ